MSISIVPGWGIRQVAARIGPVVSGTPKRAR
jgi:hypothetical protein